MMNPFPGARQPALGIQDAAMLPAQAANRLIQRVAAEGAAYAPSTQTFDSTTSSTTLNATSSTTGGGSLRSLMMPMNTDGFVPIVPNPSPAFYNGPLFSQYGDQELVAAILASQTGVGSCAGRAVLKACGMNDNSGCGCGCNCTRELSETTVIDEENSNGIIDEEDAVMMRARASAAAKATATAVPETPVATAPVAAVSEPAAAAGTEVAQAAQAAPAASIQYVTYNA